MSSTFLLASYAAVLCVGIALGIYLLPILVQPPGLPPGQVAERAGAARFAGRFVRSLRGSDPLHWGDGTIYVGEDDVVLDGRVAPGPDYKLYLSPVFVDTRRAFEQARPSMVRIGDVRAFRNFQVRLPPGVRAEHYTTVVLWCETFHQFISSARYR